MTEQEHKLFNDALAALKTLHALQLENYTHHDRFFEKMIEKMNWFMDTPESNHITITGGTPLGSIATIYKTPVPLWVHLGEDSYCLRDDDLRHSFFRGIDFGVSKEWEKLTIPQSAGQ